MGTLDPRLPYSIRIRVWFQRLAVIDAIRERRERREMARLRDRERDILANWPPRDRPDHPDGPAGVREPRRPRPSAGAAAMEPERDED